MRFQQLTQLAMGLDRLPAGGILYNWFRHKLDRAKWSLWNGQSGKSLSHLRFYELRKTDTGP